MQEGAAHIQGQVRTVDHALQEHQEIRDDLLDVVGDEHLAGKQLDLALAGTEIVGDFGEIEDALQVEGIIHIQVHVEQRLVVHMENLLVEIPVFLIGAVLGLFEPQGGCIVDMHRRFGRFVLCCLALFFRLLRLYNLEIHRLRHKLAVAAEHLKHLVLVGELLLVVGKLQDDGRSAGFAAAVRQLIFHAVFAFPLHGRCALGVAAGLDGHFLGDHERGVEAQAEVADDAALVFTLVVFQKLLGAGKRHLIDVLFNLVLGHADAVIRKAQLPFFGIERHRYAIVGLRAGVGHLLLDNRVAGVGYHFADENILIGIQPTLDDRHDILGMNGNIALALRHAKASYNMSICGFQSPHRPILSRKKPDCKQKLALNVVEC